MSSEGCGSLGRDSSQDHVHMCLQIAPKFSLAFVIGFLKGKSAIWIAREFSEVTRGFVGKHFWARGALCRRGVGMRRRFASTSAIRSLRTDEPINWACCSQAPNRGPRGDAFGRRQAVFGGSHVSCGRGALQVAEKRPRGFSDEVFDWQGATREQPGGL